MLTITTYYLAPSPIHGLGVFAARPLARGTAVWRFEPTVDRYQRTPLHDADAYYGWREADGYYVPGDDARYLNHSLRPNLQVDVGSKPTTTVAARDIAAHEELTENYGDYDLDFPSYSHTLAECRPMSSLNPLVILRHGLRYVAAAPYLWQLSPRDAADPSWHAVLTTAVAKVKHAITAAFPRATLTGGGVQLTSNDFWQSWNAELRVELHESLQPYSRWWETLQQTGYHYDPLRYWLLVPNPQLGAREAIINSTVHDNGVGTVHFGTHADVHIDTRGT